MGDYFSTGGDPTGYCIFKVAPLKGFSLEPDKGARIFPRAGVFKGGHREVGAQILGPQSPEKFSASSFSSKKRGGGENLYAQDFPRRVPKAG